MKKHITALSAAVLLLASVFAGCASVDGEPANKTSGDIFASVPTSVSNAALPPAEVSSTPGEEVKDFPTKAKIYKQKKMLFIEEQLTSLFLDTPQKVDTGYDHYIRYESDTEIGILTDGDYLNVYTPASKTYDMVYESGFLEFNGNEGYEDGTHDFATREEILEQVKDLLWDTFGIPREELYVREFYAVKKETVELYKEEVFKEANAPVTSSNALQHDKWADVVEELKTISGKDYYYLNLGFYIDGNPYYSGGGFFYGHDDFTSSIMSYRADIIYTEDGIEKITLGNITETDISGAQEVDIISPDEAKALIQQKYDSIIFDGEIDIYDMQFVYLPIPQNNLGEIRLNFEARPYYAFYCWRTENYNGEQITYYNDIIYFDAVTGKEFATERINIG